MYVKCSENVTEDAEHSDFDVICCRMSHKIGEIKDETRNVVVETEMFNSNISPNSAHLRDIRL